MFRMKQKLCKGTKDVQREHTMYKGNKKYERGTKNASKGPMMTKCYFLWHIIILISFCVALCGLFWPYMSLFSLLGHACMVLYGLIWSYVDMYGLFICYLVLNHLFSRS